MNWYLKTLRKYGDFNGRASRTEFWMFVLFNGIIGAGIVTMTKVFNLEYQYFELLIRLFILFILVPSLAVSVRRLHDTGQNGLMLLVVFIPIIGPFWLLVLMLTDSQMGINKYGPCPK